MITLVTTLCDFIVTLVTVMDLLNINLHTFTFNKWNNVPPSWSVTRPDPILNSYRSSACAELRDVTVYNAEKSSHFAFLLNQYYRIVAAYEYTTPPVEAHCEAHCVVEYEDVFEVEDVATFEYTPPVVSSAQKVRGDQSRHGPERHLLTTRKENAMKSLSHLFLMVLSNI